MKERMLLYAVSFLTNAAILIFEIAGGRLLAPYLGTSVEVWAGTIAVVLGGMALGYHLGGRIGDASASKATIVHFLFGAGLAALIAWAVRDLVPSAVVLFPIPLTLSAVIVGVVLYMPTVILLAIVSPLIAKKLLTGLDTSARVVGTLNAVGTAGSIAGAVGTGLFLIPLMGVDMILLSVALLIFGIALLVSMRDFLKRALILVLIGGGALALNAVPTTASFAMADISTTYNRILIYETEFSSGKTIRMVSTDPFGTQCAMEKNGDGTLNQSALVFQYLRGFSDIARNLVDTPAPRALFLGGCNYSYPRVFLFDYPDGAADVVEIDPGMTRTARDFFAFEPERTNVSIHHEDARMFLNKNEIRYDVIFMDTFGSSTNIPSHLTTKETFKRLEASLSENGTLLVNIIGAPSGPGSAFTFAMLMTARSVFPYAETYAFENDPGGIQNMILVASSNPLPETFPSRLPEDRLVRVEGDIGMILTDVYAPVEYLTRYNRKGI